MISRNPLRVYKKSSMFWRGGDVEDRKGGGPSSL